MWDGVLSPLALALSLAIHIGAILVTYVARPADPSGQQEFRQTTASVGGDTFDVELVGHGSSPGPGPVGDARERFEGDSAMMAPAARAPEPELAPRPAAAPALAAEPADEPPGGSGAARANAEAGSGQDQEPTVPVAAIIPDDAAALSEDSAPGASVSALPSAPGREGGHAESGRGSDASTGSYGAVGPAGGVRDLAQAFTRALPAAVAVRDTAWHALPWGPGAEARVTLRLDDEGKLLDVEIHEPRPTDYLATLLMRVRLLLQRGQFSLPATLRTPGQQTFQVRVELSRRERSDLPWAEPHHIMHRGFAAPTHDHPGQAYFTFASGRHVRLVVTLMDP